MNKHMINNDVYENYVDASVALFMEYYSRYSLSERVQAELDVANGEEVKFPAHLDERCCQLIKSEMARFRRKQYIKNCLKGIKYAAACLMVLLSVTSVLFMTVEAIRVPIINYYITQRDGHWEIDGGMNNNTAKAGREIDLENLLDNLIPGDYALVLKNGDSLDETTVIYENREGRRLYCKSESADGWVAIDSEKAEISQQCKIYGYDAIAVTKDGVVNITWIHSDLGVVFTIIAEDMSESQVVALVEQLIELINT